MTEPLTPGGKVTVQLFKYAEVKERQGYERGRADRELELKKAFNKLYGSEYSWSEVIALADKEAER